LKEKVQRTRGQASQASWISASVDALAFGRVKSLLWLMLADKVVDALDSSGKPFECARMSGHLYDWRIETSPNFCLTGYREVLLSLVVRCTRKGCPVIHVEAGGGCRVPVSKWTSNKRPGTNVDPAIVLPTMVN
jgi:hypothetical protein